MEKVEDVKRVTSADAGDIEDNEGTENEGGENTGNGGENTNQGGSDEMMVGEIWYNVSSHYSH